MSAPLLRLTNVGWRTATATVLEGVSFDVAPGEFVAILGRNGVGKSTLLDIVAGLRAPAQGDVLLEGTPIARWPSAVRARRLAHLPQQTRADVSIDVESLVLMGRYAHAGQWFEGASDREIAVDAMRRCGCLELRDRGVSTLSGGERQRALLAACLAQRTRLLLLDEPATFLDVEQQLHAFTVLRAEADRGVACVAVTHDINLALTFCTRLIVLAGRTLARDLPARTALAHPEWLRLFSPRLHVEAGRGGSRWVRYQ